MSKMHYFINKFSAGGFPPLEAGSFQSEDP